MPPSLRRARASEAILLSEIAIQSKAHWGYDADFMAACKDELTVSAESISNPEERWIVATDAPQVFGFYGLVPGQDNGVVVLEALFVRPDAIGSGVGRLLLEDAVTRAARNGYARMSIQGDPNAEGFYLAMGAVPAGRMESGSIPGRILPLFEITL